MCLLYTRTTPSNHHGWPTYFDPQLEVARSPAAPPKKGFPSEAVDLESHWRVRSQKRKGGWDDVDPGIGQVV